VSIGFQEFSGRGKTEAFGQTLLFALIDGDFGDAGILDTAQDGLDATQEEIIFPQRGALVFFDKTECGETIQDSQRVGRAQLRVGMTVPKLQRLNQKLHIHQPAGAGFEFKIDVLLVAAFGFNAVTHLADLLQFHRRCRVTVHNLVHHPHEILAEFRVTSDEARLGERLPLLKLRAFRVVIAIRGQ
jgi:hypothetical protein